jgi:hypothetical protein
MINRLREQFSVGVDTKALRSYVQEEFGDKRVLAWPFLQLYDINYLGLMIPDNVIRIELKLELKLTDKFGRTHQ